MLFQGVQVTVPGSIQQDVDPGQIEFQCSQAGIIEVVIAGVPDNLGI
jgi:hypothetical protein